MGKSKFPKLLGKGEKHIEGIKTGKYLISSHIA